MTTQDHLLAVHGMAAGAVGAFMAGIGLTDVELIGVAFAACVLGSLRAPAVGRARGLLLFAAAMLTTGKLAQTISPALAVWLPVLTVLHWRILVAIVCGTMLYPALQAMWDAAPKVVDRLASRGTGGGST